MISSEFFTKSKKLTLCLSTQNLSERDIAVFFEFFIAFSKAFLDVLRPTDSLQKRNFTFLIASISISFSLICPATPRKVYIVLSESGVIKIRHVPVGVTSFFFRIKIFNFFFL